MDAIEPLVLGAKFVTNVVNEDVPLNFMSPAVVKVPVKLGLAKFALPSFALLKRYSLKCM